VSQTQQEAFEAMFAQFMYVTLTPLRRLDSPELRTALALLGAVPPSRKKVAGPLLDRAYDEAVSRSIAGIEECSAVCNTMDGWKKRAAEHGTPIITVIILLPDGSAQFWKVRCPLIKHLTLMPAASCDIISFWLLKQVINTAGFRKSGECIA
jgi:hypothetical protein